MGSLILFVIPNHVFQAINEALTPQGLKVLEARPSVLHREAVLGLRTLPSSSAPTHP